MAGDKNFWHEYRYTIGIWHTSGNPGSKWYWLQEVHVNIYIKLVWTWVR